MGAIEHNSSAPLRHLANVLSGMRLLLAIPIVLLILGHPDGWRPLAATLFALAGATDLLDGYVARHWGAVSPLGKFLDPLADKFVVDGCIVALVFRSQFPLPIAAILLTRDLLITAMRWRTTGDELTPGRAAKAKTFCLYMGVGGLLLGPNAGDVIQLGAWILIGLATLLSLFSLLNYVRRLRWRVPVSPSLLYYLLLPRPGPLFSAGKVGFFLLGSLVAVTSSTAAGPLSRWLLVFLFYELVVSQAKYLFNDACGRFSDAYFLRGGRNRCPKAGWGLALLLIYAAARAAFGVGSLLVVAGWSAAVAGTVTVALQILYDLVKAVPLRGRGGWIFGLASANYGVRALAGMVAASGLSILSYAGLLVILWFAALGGLFLSIYWQRQGAYYIRRKQLSPALLGRYKPGVLAVYRRGLHAATPGGTPLEEMLLLLLSLSAALFFLTGQRLGSLTLAISAVAFIAIGVAGLATVLRSPPARGWRFALSEAAIALTIVCTTLGGLYFRAPSLLPSTLLASALLTYLIVSSPSAEALVLHGSRDRDSTPP
jgi:CDP-diacylglycerol--glycerol-3-phosphate 3-phosphatidyltransferase